MNEALFRRPKLTVYELGSELLVMVFFLISFLGGLAMLSFAGASLAADFLAPFFFDLAVLLLTFYHCFKMNSESL